MRTTGDGGRGTDRSGDGATGPRGDPGPDLGPPTSDRRSADSPSVDADRIAETFRYLASVIAVTRESAAWRKARREMERIPRLLLVPALVRHLNSADNRVVYERVARSLARIGGDEVLEVLYRQALTQRRFTGLAIGALSECRHPSVAPMLADLLDHGTRIRQRRSAALALGRIRDARGITPLCRMAARGDRDAGPQARSAMRAMGSPRALGRLVLREQSFTAADRIQALESLSRVLRFDPERFLLWEQRNFLSDLRAEAHATAQLWHDRATLLRPSEAAEDSVLLRPAASAPDDDSDTLLRSADLEEDEWRPEPEPGRLGGILAAFRRLLPTPRHP